MPLSHMDPRIHQGHRLRKNIVLSLQTRPQKSARTPHRRSPLHLVLRQRFNGKPGQPQEIAQKIDENVDGRLNLLQGKQVKTVRQFVQAAPLQLQEER